MAGLFDTLGTATRGLQVVQSGIATTGHNIANADTPGYTRQRSVIEASLPQMTNAGAIGTGVEQISVERIFDRFVAERLVRETSRQATLGTQASIYRQLESVVSSQEGEGLAGDLTSFFDALDDLSNAIAPGQEAERSQLVAAGQSLVDSVHRYDTQLRELQRAADRGISGLLSEVNAISAEIASLNQKIATAEVTAPANDLRDQREQLVLSLAEKVDIALVTDNQGHALDPDLGGPSARRQGPRGAPRGRRRPRLTRIPSTRASCRSTTTAPGAPSMRPRSCAGASSAA
jgi:flagellar hook-associated protein 1 FlgK